MTRTKQWSAGKESEKVEGAIAALVPAKIQSAFLEAQSL